ncbi:MAG: hypothetical protein AAB579_00705 [Patescibacteria group bacterium]
MSEEWHKTLDKLGKDNIHVSQEILADVKVIRRRLFWIQLIAWLKLAIIATPIILLLLWLPPRLKVIWKDYQSISKEIEVLASSSTNPIDLLKVLLPLLNK